MAPSGKDIDAMRQLKKIMEGNIDPVPQSSKAPRFDGMTGKPDVDAMSAILKRFNTASEGTAEKLVEDSKYNSELHEYLNTQKTHNGVKIGQFEVTSKLTESFLGKSQKVYNVIGSDKSVVVESLMLSEAAHAIVRYLNKGLDFDNVKIQTVIDLEETYARNRLDAMRFKHRHNRCVKLKESEAGHIFANRYQAARANALVALDQITNILSTIR